jgi:hypothetical protein
VPDIVLSIGVGHRYVRFLKELTLVRQKTGSLKEILSTMGTLKRVYRPHCDRGFQGEADRPPATLRKEKDRVMKGNRKCKGPRVRDNHRLKDSCEWQTHGHLHFLLFPYFCTQIAKSLSFKA